MFEVIALFLLAPFAAIGAVTVGNITGSYVYNREVKRKEKFKRNVLEALEEEK